MFHGITYVLQGTQICYYKKQNQKAGNLHQLLFQSQRRMYCWFYIPQIEYICLEMLQV